VGINSIKRIYGLENCNNKFSEYSDNINEDDDEVYDEQKDIDNQKNISRL
jgi:hypothetical protein